MLFRILLICSSVLLMIVGWVGMANSATITIPPINTNAIIIEAIKYCALFIGGLFTFIGTLLGVIARNYKRQRRKEHLELVSHINRVDEKLEKNGKKIDTMHHVLLSCEGCRESAESVGIRLGYIDTNKPVNMVGSDG